MFIEFKHVPLRNGSRRYQRGSRRRAFINGQMVMTTERRPLGELAANLLDALANEQFVAREVVLRAAGLHHGIGDGSNIFSKRLTRLRKALARHNLVVDYYPGLGYRLRRIDQESEPRAA